MEGFENEIPQARGIPNEWAFFLHLLLVTDTSIRIDCSLKIKKVHFKGNTSKATEYKLVELQLIQNCSSKSMHVNIWETITANLT